MTTAEANNERATVDEFVERLAEVLADARGAGLRDVDIALLLMTHGATRGIDAGLDAASLSAMWREACQMANRVRAQRQPLTGFGPDPADSWPGVGGARPETAPGSGEPTGSI